MTFRPNPGDTINICGSIYRVAEHPAAPGMAYGQTGRRGTVYQIIDESGEAWALANIGPEAIEAVPALIQAHGDVLVVRDGAAVVLKKITGQDFGDDANRWREWREKQN